jgi:hypothetical protein
VLLQLRVRVSEEFESSVANAQAMQHDVPQPLLDSIAELEVREACEGLVCEADSQKAICKLYVPACMLAIASHTAFQEYPEK